MGRLTRFYQLSEAAAYVFEHCEVAWRDRQLILTCRLCGIKLRYPETYSVSRLRLFWELHWAKAHGPYVSHAEGPLHDHPAEA